MLTETEGVHPHGGAPCPQLTHMLQRPGTSLGTRPQESRKALNSAGPKATFHIRLMRSTAPHPGPRSFTARMQARGVERAPVQPQISWMKAGRWLPRRAMAPSASRSQRSAYAHGEARPPFPALLAFEAASGPQRCAPDPCSPAQLFQGSTANTPPMPGTPNGPKSRGCSMGVARLETSRLRRSPLI